MIPTEYKYTTEMLLEWGQLAIQETDADENLAEVEEAVLQSDTLASDIRTDLPSIFAGAADAFRILNQEEMIGVTQDEDAWIDGADAFDMLDDLVYLLVGVKHLIWKHDPGLANEILNQLEPAYESVSEKFISSDFSSLRLATFNENRRNFLTGIHPEFHYLFPWHALQNEESTSILTTLAEHYNNLSHPDKLPSEISRNLFFYIAEIQSDKILSRHLRKENYVLLKLQEMLKAHWAFPLWRSCKSEGYKRLLPEEVEKQGVISVSSKLLKQHGLQQSQDQFVLDVSAAFYAPNIEDSERIKRLLQYEKELKANWQQYHVETESGKLIEKLHLLAEGKIDVQSVSTCFLDYWFHQLESIVSIPLKRKIAGWLTDIDACLTGLLEWHKQDNHKISVRCNEVYAGETESNKPKTYEAIVNYDNIPSKLHWVTKGDEIILLSKLPEEFEKTLKNVTTKFSFGFMWNANHEMQKIDIDPHYSSNIRKIPNNFNGQNIQSILLIIEFDEKVIDHTIKVVTELINKLDQPFDNELKSALKSAIVLYYSANS